MTTNLPVSVTVATIIAQVETGCNARELRFEPGVYRHITNGIDDAERAILASIIKINKCSLGTAQMIYSTSFGIFQVMGFNLYGSLKYTKGIFDYVDSVADQNATFNLFCEQKKIVYTPVEFLDKANRYNFARVYNGNPNAYEPMIEIAMRHFGVQV